MHKSFEHAGCSVAVYLPPGRVRDLIYVVGRADTGDQLWESISGMDAALAVVECTDRNGDLSPWPALGVYNAEGDFTGGASEFLELLRGGIMPRVLSCIDAEPERTGIAGYSMSGLFALWSAFNAPEFSLVCSASGAVWYDGWLEYLAANTPARSDAEFYLSVGRRERKTRNLRMAKVVENTGLSAQMLEEKGFAVIFELNEGGHFTDPAGRLAKGIKKIVSNS